MLPIRSTNRKVRRAAWVCLTLLAFLSACGSSIPEPQGPPPQVSQEVSTLKILLRPSKASNVDEALAAKLFSAGFTIVDQPHLQHDVVGNVRVSMTEEQQFFQVQVNGVRQRKFRVSVIVALQSAQGTIEQAETSFTITNDELHPAHLDSIARKLANSPRLAKYARDLGQWKRQEQQSRHLAEARQRQQAEAEQRAQAQRLDANAWIDAKAHECEVPRRLDACEKVARYLANHPEGLHAVEARQTLYKAQPKLEELRKDEAEWQAADAQTCRALANEDGCAGVEIYRVKYPAGLHAGEATMLLERVGQ